MKGYFPQINENKYLTLVPTNKSKELMKKYEKLLSKSRNLIKSISKNSDDHDEKYMKMNIWSFLRWIFIQIMNSITMLYYVRHEVSEGINVNKLFESKECDILLTSK